jgi:flavin-binding protein dodecin
MSFHVPLPYLSDDHRSEREDEMQDHHVYKIVELVGSSPDSIEDAIKSAIARAHLTLRNLRWFEVIETRGHIENGEVHHYQVTLKVGFTLEDDQSAG